MNITAKKRVCSLLLAVSLIAGAGSAIPVCAAAENITLVFEDVTQSNETTLAGEAKIKVSVEGAGGNVSVSQMALKFSGELDYKSIEFLQGENNADRGNYYVIPDSAYANVTSNINVGIINAKTPITFTDEKTDLFILTFEGDAGDSVNLSLNTSSNFGTYCTVDGDDIVPLQSAAPTQSATAAAEANEAKTAIVKLTMDKVTDFTQGASSGYNTSEIELKITSETKPKYTIYTVLNNTLKSAGGHRENGLIPQFTIENTVLANDTYTVELTGLGYVSYKKTGVTFDEALELTNEDFIPGDIVKNDVVDADDKASCEQFIADNDYSKAADFNRDGDVDSHDLAMFSHITTDGGDTGGGDTGGGDTGGGNVGGGDAGGGDTGGGDTGGGNVGGGDTGSGIVAGGITGSSSDDIFTDLGNYAWAKDAIYTLKDKGIISGTSETTYSPQNNIKRGDFILILVRMLGIEADYSENFADVLPNSYYYDAIGKAKAAGIATGDGTNFMPEASITRQDLITLAYRAFLNMGYIQQAEDTSAIDAFSDKAEISEYALNSMASMVAGGIIKGSDGKVNPKGNATRAEVAVMCARLVELIK